MYSATFLTVCVVCKTAQKILQTNRNKETSCAGCFSRFIAQENLINVEEMLASQLTSVQADEELHNDDRRKYFSINNQQEVREIHKEMHKNSLIQKQHSLEVDANMVFSKPLGKVTLANQSRDEATESKEQQLKIECTDRTKDSKEHHNDRAVTSIAAPLLVKGPGFRSDGREEPHNDTKKKRKYSHNSATQGVALRKPSRERKKVRAYSPSRERTFRKKAKLRLNKGGKYDHNVVSQYKSKGEKVKKQDWREIRENSISAGNGDVNKCKTIPDGTTDKLLISDPEVYSDEFKQFMKEEIKRQILNGLGDACTSAEIEAIEVDKIAQYTASSIHELKDSVPEEQHYLAKTKLKVTLVFPVTLRPCQGPPQDFQKPMQADTQPGATIEPKVFDGYQCKGIETKRAEFIKDVNDIKESESTGMFKDTREPETRGLMEPEKLHNEPLLESESSEEIDVPESEFYDFECERSADKFSPGQIWASYDNRRDAMPRFYVQIERVTSVSPFKLQITFLEPRGFPDSDKAGNALTCGVFSTNKRMRVMDKINAFSHIMNWEKGQDDMICIYPAEKQVWALYKNWQELDLNRRIKFGFEIVKIVAIEKDDLTVSVIPLINFKGSRTVFVQQDVEPFKIHNRDFARFSHQIPTYEILDLEGCMELDPAATPH